MINSDLNVILPELALAVYAMAALMWAVYRGKDAEAPMLFWLTSLVLAGLGLWIGLEPEGTSTAFNGAFINDGFARFSKVVILFSASIVLMMSQDYLKRNALLKFEFPILVALSVVGMMMMVSSGDLMALYMGLELLSVALHVLAAFRRDSVRATEAGLMYCVRGALCSGLLLYGASLIYGFAGTTTFAGITAAVGEEGLSTGLLIGMVFLITGFAFKVSAVPFHMWAPDVYEGSPTPVTAFFATAPKAAAMSLFARVMFDAFGGATAEWGQVVALLSFFSMFLGAIAAIGQTNIKRLMAYSSIGHMGYAMMGLAAGTGEGVQSMLIYVVVYVATNIGVFAFILNMEKDGQAVTDIASLNMYSQVEPLRAAALMVLMFSLAGAPPLVGFFSKVFVVQAAINADLLWLAIAGMIASVIGAYYYIRIIYLMYFGEPRDPLDGSMPAFHWAALMASAFVMVVGVINLFGVESLAGAAAATLLK